MSAPPRRPGWQALDALGLAVRPATLRAGLRPPALERGLLTCGDVGAWARAREDADDDPAPALFELAALHPATGNDRDSLVRTTAALDALTAADAPADPGVEARKWRLAELAGVIDAIAAWPESDDPYDDPACEMWSVCRELWEAWAEVDRPSFFFRPDGGTVTCYHGRPLADELAAYRDWIEDERAALIHADRRSAASRT